MNLCPSGAYFVVGVEHCEGPTPSILSHSSLESITELLVSLLAPAGMHFRILVDGGLTAGNSLEGKGTILFRSFAVCSSDIVRVADVPCMGTHCAMSH